MVRFQRGRGWLVSSRRLGTQLLPTPNPGDPAKSVGGSGRSRCAPLFAPVSFLLKDNRGPKSNDHHPEVVNPQTSPLQSSEGGQKRSTGAIYSRERNYRKIMRAKSAASSPSLSGDDQLRAANCGRRRRAQSDSRPCRRSVGPDKKALPPSRIVTRTLTEIDGRTHRRPTKPFSLEGRARRGCREGKDKKEGERFVQYGSANRRKAESRVFRPRNAGPRGQPY